MTTTKMKRRKILYFLLSLLILVCTLTGCGTAQAGDQEAKPEFASVEELSDKVIASFSNSPAILKLQKDLPNATFCVYNTSPEMLQALKAGKIDAFCMGELPTTYRSGGFWEACASV